MRKQRIVTVSILFLAVEVEGERLTLAMIVFDHDFERLSFGRECVVIEAEVSRRDGIAIVRREGFAASADAQRPSAVVREIQAARSPQKRRPCALTRCRAHASAGTPSQLQALSSEPRDRHRDARPPPRRGQPLARAILRSLALVLLQRWT